MKKYYYLSNTNERLGPFTKAELNSEKISKNTFIWFEGMTDWKEAWLIDEIRDIFIVSTPPPPPPSPKVMPNADLSSNQPIKKKSNSTAVVLTILLVGVIIALIAVNQNNKSTGNSSYSSISNSGQTYEEKVMSVEETEKSNPSSFLTASGTYHPNLWGDQFKLNGTITSSATVAKFKDFEIEVIYYSNTDTELSRKRFTIYQSIAPGRTIQFEKKISKPSRDFSKIGWQVISATAL